jgi:hypothetical protein
MSFTLSILQNYTIYPRKHFVSLTTKNNPHSKYTKYFLQGCYNSCSPSQGEVGPNQLVLSPIKDT